MYCEVNPSDADLITRLVHFNNIFLSRYLNIFSHKIFQDLHKCELYSRPAFVKSDLKDVIAANPPYRTQRIDELISEYRAEPGRFYRETPFHATLFFKKIGAADEYLGSSRKKRVHRMAEKSARRIIDWMFGAIRKRADLLADDRARILGVPRDQLATSQEEMTEEFLKAENRLVEDFKQKREIHDVDDMIINDVAGMKVILEDSQQEELLSVLRNMEGCEIVEEEKHAGKYNATNVIVRYAPPRDAILSHDLSEKIIDVMRLRRSKPGDSNRDFAEFVRSGEDHIYMEIIVSDYEEMLESEIGRCMHEDRIIEQRLRQPYNGHLAKNIEYLMEYLFVFPYSAQYELGELPIKLWNRYLPDYFDEVLRKLYHIPRGNTVEE
ncbi:MAG: hypothetical protein ACXWMI_10820 [Syntrophales bacterium]